jgi:hypothetical protein
MTIYDNHGKILWNKVNQPVTGGKNSQLEQVVLPNGYAGNITILIHKMRQKQNTEETKITALFLSLTTSPHA